jgi:hypothetical protein
MGGRLTLTVQGCRRDDGTNRSVIIVWRLFPGILITDYHPVRAQAMLQKASFGLQIAIICA